MRWDWDVTADDRVVKLWQLRRELAESQELFYSKWYKDRATVFSFEFFCSLYRILRPLREGLSHEARELLELLEFESPLSTKQLRRGSDLTGRSNEKRYHSAMRELWRSLSIAGIGEVDDGAFPSLAHASTVAVFESQVQRADDLSLAQAEATLGACPEALAFARRLLSASGRTMT